MKSVVDLVVILLPQINLLEILVYLVLERCMHCWCSISRRIRWLHEDRDFARIARLHYIFDAVFEAHRDYSSELAHTPLEIPGFHTGSVVEPHIR